MAHKSQKKTRPLVSKGTRFPFQTCVVCWIDLLGYGAMIARAEFNPLHAEARKALARLRRFHAVVAKHSARNFPTLVINDGAAAYRDLSLRTRSVTYYFLVRAWDLFKEIQETETAEGHPGARLVLATGFRMHDKRAGVDLRNSKLEAILRRFQKNAITAEQAIIEATSVRQDFDIVPQLQANFAFTKAYVAEASGTKGGLPGPHFYVDLSIFADDTPGWIQLGPTIRWSDPRLGLHADFAAIRDLPPQKRVPAGPVGILDGHQIAQVLADNPDVLSALRTAIKP